MHWKNLTMIMTALFLLILAGCQNEAVNELQWRCSAVVCAQTMEGPQWANQYCLQNGNETVCPVILDGQQVLVPLSNINLSAVEQCIAYTCVEEQQFRAVNYSINVTQ